MTGKYTIEQIKRSGEKVLTSADEMLTTGKITTVKGNTYNVYFTDDGGKTFIAIDCYTQY